MKIARDLKKTNDFPSRYRHTLTCKDVGVTAANGR